jgi:hypothetical protein
LQGLFPHSLRNFSGKDIWKKMFKLRR